MPARRGLALCIIVSLALATPSWAQQQAFRWETNFDQARATAASSNRLLLVHFGAPWCKPCRELENNVFKQPGFGQQLASQYVAVKLDLDQNQALAQSYGVKAIPTDVIVSPQGQVLFMTHSPSSADKYVNTMQQIATKFTGPAASVASKPASALPSLPVSPAPPPQSFAPQPPQGQPQQFAPPAGAQSNRTTDSRYDYYFSGNGAPGATASAPPVNTAPPVAPPAQVVAAPPQGFAPQQPPIAAPVDTRYAADARYAPDNRYAQPPPIQSPVAPPSAAPVAPSAAATTPRTVVTQAQLPPGSPPLGLEGFCPILLSERRQWVPGDVMWGAVHRGRTYLFSGPAEQQKFLSNPDRYSPVMSGNDPVAALNQGQAINGRREFGFFYGERVYLFASEESLTEFERNPNRYAAEITAAMRQ